MANHVLVEAHNATGNCEQLKSDGIGQRFVALSSLFSVPGKHLIRAFPRKEPSGNSASERANYAARDC